MGNHSLVQGIFPNQGSNPGLPNCRQILYQVSHQWSPYYCQLNIQDSINDRDEQTDEEYRARCRRVPSSGASTPRNECTTLPAHGGVHQPAPCFLKFLWNFRYTDLIDSIFCPLQLIPFPALPPPHRRLENETECSNSLITWLVPLATSPHPEVI